MAFGGGGRSLPPEMEAAAEAKQKEFEEMIAKEGQENGGGGGGAKRSGPRVVMCYICGKEFGRSSIDIHERQCAKKWEDTEAQKPPRERRPLPQKPDVGEGASLEERNAAVKEAYETQAMAECPGCGRRFKDPETLQKHRRTCRSGRGPSPSPGTFGTSGGRQLPPEMQAAADAKQKEFEDMIAKEGQEHGGGGGKRSGPRVVMCYICGREFGKTSIDIHERQCAKKWEDTEAQKPPRERRPLPRKPEVGEGASLEERNAAIKQAYESQAMAECPSCGRRFKDQETMQKHQRTCRSGHGPSPGAFGGSGGRQLPPEMQAAADAKQKEFEEMMAKDAQEHGGGGSKRTGPRVVMCYICGKEFGRSSIEIHERQCAKKWEDTEAQKPPRERRPLPRKPDVAEGATLEERNAAVKEVYEAQAMVHCPSCGRRFKDAETMQKHQRTCRGGSNASAGGAQLRTADSGDGPGWNDDTSLPPDDQDYQALEQHELDETSRHAEDDAEQIVEEQPDELADGDVSGERLVEPSQQEGMAPNSDAGGDRDRLRDPEQSGQKTPDAVNESGVEEPAAEVIAQDDLVQGQSGKEMIDARDEPGTEELAAEVPAEDDVAQSELMSSQRNVAKEEDSSSQQQQQQQLLDEQEQPAKSPVGLSSTSASHQPILPALQALGKEQLCEAREAVQKLLDFGIHETPSNLGDLQQAISALLGQEENSALPGSGGQSALAVRPPTEARKGPARPGNAAIEPPSGEHPAKLRQEVAQARDLAEGRVNATGEEAQAELTSDERERCSRCDMPIAESYYEHEDGRVCGACHAEMAPLCARCGEPILAGSVIVDDNRYHEECFSCSTCNALITGPYYKDGTGYTCEQCRDENAPKCFACECPVLGRSIMVGDSIYHDTCFICSLCAVPISGDYFLEDGRILCTNCSTASK